MRDISERPARSSDRHRAPPPSPRPSHSRAYFGAVDLGTNNCRLLVAHPESDNFRVVDAFSRVVRLGEGVADSHHLSAAAMSRTLGALRICARKLDRYRHIRVRCVATEACRQAENYDAFLGRVRRETGLQLEVISAQEEALLALEGCLSLRVPDRPDLLVFDIGGGSTEIIWLPEQTDPAATTVGVRSLSVPVGVVTVAERWGTGSADRDVFQALVTDLVAQFADFDARHQIGEKIAAGRVQMIGTSGTVTTLAGVHLGLERYDRRVVDGCFLDFTDIQRVIDHLQALDPAGRAQVGSIGQDRVDLVMPGVAILQAICQVWPVGRLRVADRGLREGILLGMMRAADDAAHGLARGGLAAGSLVAGSSGSGVPEL